MTRDELLMKLYDEQTTQARHHESLRVNFVSIVLTLGAVMIAIVGYDEGLTQDDIPVLVFLFLLGLFGYVASLKHYERNRLHVARARVMREMAESALDIEDVGRALYDARIHHQSKNRFMSRKIRLRFLWAVAPLLLSVASLLLIVMTVGS